MKKSDIQVGKRYTDGKGHVRYVVANEPGDKDCVAYCKVKDGVAVKGKLISTRAAFAAWAKAEVKQP